MFVASYTCCSSTTTNSDNMDDEDRRLAGAGLPDAYDDSGSEAREGREVAMAADQA